MPRGEVPNSIPVDNGETLPKYEVEDDGVGAGAAVLLLLSCSVTDEAAVALGCIMAAACGVAVVVEPVRAS